MAQLLIGGPETAVWPYHVKQAWFGPDGGSAQARQGFEWIKRSAVIDVPPVQMSPKSRQRMAKKGKHRTDFPVGVRRSPPLR
jgi:hypothetical protein